MSDNRNHRATVAQETLAILRAGSYRCPLGREVDLTRLLAESQEATELIRPEEWPAICEQAAPMHEQGQPAAVEVTPETTLAAARRLSAQPGRRVLALNFASAKHPGGGFMGGAQAQEESLARASGLYPCLLRQPEYYVANRRGGSLLYTDHAIHSPRVPVFRDDADKLLGEPFAVGFLTMPAPNVGAMRDNSPDIEQVTGFFRRRTEYVLALAVARRYTHVVAGAWGCGVFRNDPTVVADAFAAALATWGRRLDGVTFAILDRGGRIRDEFTRCLILRQSPGGRR